MAAALGLREEDLELSMGMSADYEQAVRTLTLNPAPPPALPACHPAAHGRFICLSMGMACRLGFETGDAHLLTCLPWPSLPPSSLSWRFEMQRVSRVTKPLCGGLVCFHKLHAPEICQRPSCRSLSCKTN